MRVRRDVIVVSVSICFRWGWSSGTTTQDLGWLGGARVLGKLPVPGRPTNLD